MELLKNKIKAKRQLQGFTVVELLVASGIALIILAIVGLMYVSSERSFKFGQTALNSEADLRLAMDWITRDIRGAESIQGNRLELSGDSVTITIPAGDIIYALKQNDTDVSLELTRTGPNPDTVDRTIAEEIVVYFDSATTSVTITLTKEDPQRTLTSIVTMRNTG